MNSVRLTNQYYYEESESTSFTTKGTVKTEDGREIDFNLNLNMSRSFMEYYEEEIDFEQLTLCDPLVSNLEGNVAQVSDQTFFFDIDLWLCEKGRRLDTACGSCQARTGRVT